MTSAIYLCRVSIAITMLAAMCQASFAQAERLDTDQQSSDKSAVDALPSFEVMVTTALRHNPDMRAAQAELERARLQVVQEIRAFCEERRAATAALAEVTIAQREVDRLREVGPGAIAGKQLLEAEHNLEVARGRAAAAEAKLRELQLLLPHLLGREFSAKPHGNHDQGHDSGDAHHRDEAHHHHDHDAIAAPVAKILRERLQLLAKIVELQQAAYKSSEASFDVVAAAHVDLMAAQLELAKSADERLKIRQQMIQVARQIEEVTERMFQAEQTSQPSVLKATALRMRAEADLKREQLATDQRH